MSPVLLDGVFIVDTGHEAFVGDGDNRPATA